MSREDEISRLKDELRRAREVEQKCDRDYERSGLQSDAARADRYGQKRMEIQHQLDRLRYPSSTSSTQSYSPPVQSEQESKPDGWWQTCVGCIFWIAVIVLVARYCGHN